MLMLGQCYASDMLVLVLVLGLGQCYAIAIAMLLLGQCYAMPVKWVVLTLHHPGPCNGHDTSWGSAMLVLRQC